MEGVAQDQGYTVAGSLGPGEAGGSQTSLANIGQAIKNLAAQAKCGDHVLIYICGHGGKKSSDQPEGGISIYDSSGSNTGELLTPSALAGFLDEFDACKDADCGTPGCCHVSVIIESCYAGNFNVPGLNDREGMAVAGSSTNTPAQGVYPGSGVYTAGFVNDSRDPDADQTDPPDGVDPLEAHGSAADAVSANNARAGKSQQPWSSNNWCECKCPCKPGIDVEKWIWYEPLGIWMDEIATPAGQLVTFRLEIESSGKCRGIVDLEVVDLLPGFFGPGSDPFEGQVTLYYDGQAYARPPDAMSQVEGGLQLTWNLEEIGPLEPGESIAIEYATYAEDAGENINEVSVSAHCAVDYSVIVTDQDAATVMVQEEELPPVETVLYGYLSIQVECSCVGTICQGCNAIISFKAEDTSTGDIYPVIYVALYVNGVQKFNSGTINTSYYQNSISMQGVGCGQEINIELVAMNLVGLEVHPTKTIITPTSC